MKFQLQELLFNTRLNANAKPCDEFYFFLIQKICCCCCCCVCEWVCSCTRFSTRKWILKRKCFVENFNSVLFALNVNVLFFSFKYKLKFLRAICNESGFIFHFTSPSTMENIYKDFRFSYNFLLSFFLIHAKRMNKKKMAILKGFISFFSFYVTVPFLWAIFVIWFTTNDAELEVKCERSKRTS